MCRCGLGYLTQTGKGSHEQGNEGKGSRKRQTTWMNEWIRGGPCSTTASDLSENFLTGELLLTSQKGLCYKELDLVWLQLQVCDGSISRPCTATKRLRTRTVIFNCESKSYKQFNVTFLLFQNKALYEQKTSPESITTPSDGRLAGDTLLSLPNYVNEQRDTNWIAERSYALCDICGFSISSATVS